jgi:Endonuclease/Exonuclease/phosphatase family
MHLRILTYNVQCLPIEGNIKNGERAEEIARRIVSSRWDYDVVCLNEVFDEGARKKFEDGLKSIYPHHISSAGGERGFVSSLIDTDKAGFAVLAVLAEGLTLGLFGFLAEVEDSGLMIFSRFPFDTQPNPVDVNGSMVPALNWKPYSQRTTMDALSEKGALAVRLQLPDGGKFVVSATHMQSSDKDDEKDADIRASQLAEAWDNMLPLLSEGSARYDFVLCGDLNVDGAMSQPDASDAGSEWKSRFSQPMSGAADYWDAVAFEQSPHLWNPASGTLTHPVDRGITLSNVPGGRRYDYFMTRPGDGSRNLQHAFIDHSLSKTTTELPFISDHWPLACDLIQDNRFPGSNAARGLPVVCDEDSPSFGTSGTLHPGQIAWLCVLNPGTYEFAVTGCELTLYGSNDLSSPLAVYTELDRGTERAVKYVLPAAPTFVKLQAADRHAAPDYSLNIRRFLGTSLRDAIGLGRRNAETSNHRLAAPNSSYECRLGDGEIVADARYFEFDVLETTSGKPQHVRVECASSSGGAPMRLILGNEVAPDVLDVKGNTPYGTGAFAMEAELKAGHYFLVAQRQPGSGFAGSNFSLSWDSNMSVLYGTEAYENTRGDGNVNPLAMLPRPSGIEFRCVEETDSPFDAGTDDIALELFADGVSILSITTDQLGGFDTGDPRWLDSWIPRPITYVDRLELKVVEEDTFVDDRGSIEIPVAAKYRNGGRPIDEMRTNGVVVVTERTDFSGGTYSLKMTLA